jgi:hypothetical protein
MTAIQSREQFLGLVAEAERLTTWLAQVSPGAEQQLCMLVLQHLAFVRATVADGAYPTAEHKAAVHLGAAAGHLGPGADGRHANEPSAWLYAVLPMLEEYYRALEPPVAPAAPPAAAPEPAPAWQPAAEEPPAAVEAEVLELELEPEPEPQPAAAVAAPAPASGTAGDGDWPVGGHVCVQWPGGARYLGYVRLHHEQSYLVAFANGQQQWLGAANLGPGPRAGEQVAAAGAGGEVLRGRVLEMSAGCYLVDVGDGRREWFEWTAIQPA